MSAGNPWADDPDIAVQQRALFDQQLAQEPWPIHFASYASAIMSTGCRGSLLEIGCGPGGGKDILDKVGWHMALYGGVDISDSAIRIAHERHPTSFWENTTAWPMFNADVAVDGSVLLHVDDWRQHLEMLCDVGKKFVILHRIPAHEHATVTTMSSTKGYGHEFPAWSFALSEVVAVMESHGFDKVDSWPADGDSSTINFKRRDQA